VLPKLPRNTWLWRLGVAAGSMTVATLALAQQYSGPIDLLIADVVMPGLSGRDLAARLTVDRPGVRVLYTSGYTENMMIRAGFETFESSLPLLTKPFLPADLLHLVGETLVATD
jgi:two-component system cell cycle sensor histidine kinase/response regulator CckA